MLDKPLPFRTIVVCLLRGAGIGAKKDPTRKRWIIFTNKVNPNPMEKSDYFHCLTNDFIRKISWRNILHDFSVSEKTRGYFRDSINYDYKLVADMRCFKYLKNEGYRIINVSMRKGKKFKNKAEGNYKTTFTKQEKFYKK